MATKTAAFHSRSDAFRMRGCVNGQAWLGLIIWLLICLTMAGCAIQSPQKKIIHQNRYLRCEAPTKIRTDMVIFVNQARAKMRRCGLQLQKAVPKIRWNQRLTIAARRHSYDMATNNRLQHDGSDGSDVGIRAIRAGYQWQIVGENVSAGHQTSQEVVQKWLQSKGHCQNIMNLKFVDIGAACYRNPNSTYGTYWTLVLAVPQR